jgi:hypothetical protein
LSEARQVPALSPGTRPAGRRTIHVGRTKDEIKDSPEFDKDKHAADPGYHEQVGGYYGGHRA